MQVDTAGRSLMLGRGKSHDHKRKCPWPCFKTVGGHSTTRFEAGSISTRKSGRISQIGSVHEELIKARSEQCDEKGLRKLT